MLYIVLYVNMHSDCPLLPALEACNVPGGRFITNQPSCAAFIMKEQNQEMLGFYQQWTRLLYSWKANMLKQ